MPDRKTRGDWIGSFECGKNVSYEILNYRTPNTKYDIMTGAGHVRAVSVDSHFTGGRVTEVIMRTYDQREQGSATVWGTVNCQGPSAELAAYSTLDKAHSFTTAEAESFGMVGGRMQAYNLPWGYELTLYDRDGMVGNSISFTGK